MHNSHDWEDVSYHGSPDYQCRFCDVMDHESKAELPCPKREEVLAREARDREQRERWEYAQLKAAKERYDYLHKKYGTE